MHEKTVLITRGYLKEVKYSCCKTKFNDGNIRNKKEK